MGQVFIRRTTAFLLFLVGVLSILCVALLVLVLAPDWRLTGAETSADGERGGQSAFEYTTKNRAHKLKEKQSIKDKSLGDSNNIKGSILFNSPTKNLSPLTDEDGIDGTTKRTEPWEKEYRIPTTTIPHHYDLYLHPNIQEGDFTGRVTILIGVTSPINYLVTHIKNLNITYTSLRRGGRESSQENQELNLKNTFEYSPNQFWVVIPESGLKPGNYSLTLHFNGILSGKLVGFYRSVYKTENGEKRFIATSKFQPTDARTAFPCFDEPSFKSTFSTTLVRPTQGYIAISNMPQEREIADSPGPGQTEVIFQKSVPMVTYLACFVVCDFDYVQTLTLDGKPFRVFARSDQVHRTNYSLHLGVNVLNYYEEYFKVKYPLPKQDMIALPDFISGAMEHWGIITYRETNLLYDDRESSSYNQQRVAAVVGHELAHMWFGNLVTLKWWDDLWLNEGFASYIEYKGVANYEKDWNMEEQFIIDDLQRVMPLDAQLTSHPIVQMVNHPDEITEIFDEISYRKGSSVLRMLEDFIGPEVFREGVSRFLKKYKYQNAVTQDLWRELEGAVAGRSHLNVSAVMDTWTRQMGLPVLNVSESKTIPGKLEVTQTRFLGDPKAVSADDSVFGYQWDVPVTLISDSSPRELHWMMRDVDKLVVSRPSGSKWVKFNVGQFGFYRVNYSPKLWQELITLLNTNPEALSPSDRSSLLDDAFSIAKAGQLPYDIVLTLMSYLERETHYIPWATALRHLNQIGRLLRYSGAYPYFREYVVSLVRDQVEQLGWEDTGSHLDRRKRLLILYLACSNGHESCLVQARDRLKAWLNDESYYIPPNTRSLVYSFGMEQLGVDAWETMLQRYINEKNFQEKDKLAVGLSHTKEDWVAQRLLVLATNESIVRSQDYLKMLGNIAANPSSTHLVWNYVRSNWEAIVDRFTLSNRYLGFMVKSVITKLSSYPQLQDVKSFFKQYPEAGSGARSRKQALEELETNLHWVDEHSDVLQHWLLTWNNQNNP